jgi:hypothetical protein
MDMPLNMVKPLLLFKAVDTIPDLEPENFGIVILTQAGI